MSNDRIIYYAPESGKELCAIPKDAVEACSHMGECMGDVEAWEPDVDWSGTAQDIRDELDGYGAWEDLGEASETTLRHRMLWVMCCNISEEPDFYGHEEEA